MRRLILPVKLTLSGYNYNNSNMYPSVDCLLALTNGYNQLAQGEEDGERVR